MYPFIAPYVCMQRPGSDDKEGKDPYCALPYLSVYLGHTDITNTEIYLRLTMERYDEVINVGHYIYERVLGGGSDD